MIEALNLTRRYGENTAVDSLSFTLPRGGICGFLGPNGAGKSTTMNMMTGCLGITAGDFLIDGVSIRQDPLAVRRMIGYLPEQPPLYGEMTPLEYLNFAAELRGLRGDEAREAVADAMSRTGLEDSRDRVISNLSKGYKQRVGLAQAILGTPPVLIFDEPTVGLDPAQIIEIRALIRDLAREHTVILSTHILSEVRELCSRVLIISRGKLMADGTVEELEAASATGDTSVLVRGEDVARLSELCAREDIPILGTSGVSDTLESIFIRLTSEDAGKEEPDESDI
ncbi:MAG: ABC transporter ATP-binding protein [Oscillospiraceae bacterium]|jgi:ABC-2 type transport system ATP-binding protein|nr:ABC transporter ATP-binding protein [Oscillospiraceae bacterium]